MKNTIAFIVIAEAPSEEWANTTETTSLGSHGEVSSPSNTGQRNLTEALQSSGLENVRIEPASQSNLSSYSSSRS